MLIAQFVSWRDKIRRYRKSMGKRSRVLKCRVRELGDNIHKILLIEQSPTPLAIKNSSVSGSDVDLELWVKLPHDILESVLAMLPPDDLIGMRLVCKQWNSVILSRALCLPDPTPQLLCSMAGSLTSYSQTKGKWTQHSLNFKHRNLYLATSDGGLLCFHNRETGGLIVYNPVTKSWRNLPPPLFEIIADAEIGDVGTLDLMGTGHVRFHAMRSRSWTAKMTKCVVGMITYKEQQRYKIVVSTMVSKEGPQTQVYDRSTNSWSWGADPPMVAWFRRSPVSCDNCLYCVVRGLREDDGDDVSGWSVIKYDLEQDAWCDIPMPRHRMGDNVFAIELAERQGRVRMFLRLMHSLIFHCWELEADGSLWRVASELQEEINEQIAVTRWTRHWDLCVGGGNLIYLVLVNVCDEEILRYVQCYDLVTKSWTRLPHIDPLNSYHCEMCLFQPSLNLTP